MKLLNFCYFIVSVFIAGTLRAEVPDWAKGPTVNAIDTNIVVINCEGKGISKQLSYQEAQLSCTALASVQKSNTIKVSQTVIESEDGPAKLHSSIESKKQVIGLIGKTENESSVESEGVFTTYLKIRYDLRHLRVTSVREEDSSSGVEGSLFTSPNETSNSSIQRKELLTDTASSVTVQLSDYCKDYIVRGKHPRTRPCGNANVIQIMVDSFHDKEIIFRPMDKRFLPETIKINPGRLPAKTNEVLDVQFKYSK